jgi:hypothetical protein
VDDGHGLSAHYDATGCNHTELRTVGSRHRPADGRESRRSDRGQSLTMERAVSSTQDCLLDEFRDGLRIVVGHFFQGVRGWPEPTLFVEFGWTLNPSVE